MTQPTQNTLDIPNFSPSTPAEHAANYSEIERWGTDLLAIRPHVVNVDGFGAWVTNSAVYVPFSPTAGLSALNVSFIKRYVWTELYVHFAVVAYGTVGLSLFQLSFSRRLLSPTTSPFTDHVLGRMFLNPANGPTHISGFARIPVTNFGPAAYYSELRVKLIGGGGSMNSDGNGCGGLSVLEVVPDTVF